VVNSCVKDCDWIRAELAGTLLDVIAKNNQTRDEIRIFEIAQVYDKSGEQRRLGVITRSYTELSHIVRDLFGAWEVGFKLGGARQKFLHPKNNAVIKIGGDVGFIGVVPDADVAVAEINLDALDLEKLNKTAARKVSKYQKNVLDFTFKTKDPYGEVEKIFKKFTHPLVMGFKLKDIFEKDGTISYTLEFTVVSYEKTLDSGDINSIVAKIIAFGCENGLKH
jgi:phenylalanyl-tRNA synthetase beta subunit